MNAPVLLKGAKAIGAHLGITAAAAQHRHTMRELPTFQIGGTPHATAAALDDWKALNAAGFVTAPPMALTSDRLIAFAQVEQIAGLKRTRIYAMIRAGTFPAPYKPGGAGSRWSEAEVRAWLASLKQARV